MYIYFMYIYMLMPEFKQKLIVNARDETYGLSNEQRLSL